MLSLPGQKFLELDMKPHPSPSYSLIHFSCRQSMVWSRNLNLNMPTNALISLKNCKKSPNAKTLYSSHPAGRNLAHRHLLVVSSPSRNAQWEFLVMRMFEQKLIADICTQEEGHVKGKGVARAPPPPNRKAVSSF